MITLFPIRPATSISRVLAIGFLLFSLLHGSTHTASAATQFDIIGPPSSVALVTSVTALPNGNIVVTDPYFNGGIAVNTGAVYLYDGFTRALISTLTGITANDKVGYGGVSVLSNGNYVIKSPYWNNGLMTSAGAVTLGDQTTAVNGVVSAGNSLVGSITNDWVGIGGVTSLDYGNFVVSSPHCGIA